MLLGQRSTLADGLSRADEALNEPSDTGVSAQLNKFWSSFQTLANNPSDSSARISVVAAGKAITSSLSDLDSRLSTIQSDALSEYTALTTGPSNQVGAYAKQLAELNDAIGHAQAAGQQPNDMLDQRDLLLDKLSELAQISVTTNPNGKLSVSFGDAASPLVNGSGATSTTNWPQTLTSPGGKLGGLIQVQSTVQGYRTQLDGVASALATGVNAIHGAPPFFTGSTASTLAVNVTASTLKAGSGTTPESNDWASAIAGMRGGHRRHGLRHARRHRRLRCVRSRGAARPLDLPRRRRPGAPPSGRRGVARRGDVEPHPVPTWVPGLGPNNDHDGRDARHPDQPHRTVGL